MDDDLVVDADLEDRRLIGLTGPEERGVDNISPLAQVRRMQRILYERTQDGDVDNRELAQLACAWERLEERKRVMVGKPAPKPVDVTLVKRQRRSSSPRPVPTPPPTSLQSSCTEPTSPV